MNARLSLTSAIRRHVRSQGLNDTLVPGVSLYQNDSPSSFEPVETKPSLSIVAQGVGEIVYAGQSYQFGPTKGVVLSVDLPVFGRVLEASPSKPFLSVNIPLLPFAVDYITSPGVSRSHAAPELGLGLNPVDTPLLDAAVRLVSLLDNPLAVEPISPLILREIAFRVLTGPCGSHLLQIATPGAPVQRIAQAITWIKSRFTERLHLDSLARKVRLSRSTFFEHFRLVTGVTPLQYIKLLRLQKAKQLMLGDGLTAAEAAYRVGYESSTQFSREYRRLFGSPPHRDVMAARTKLT